MNKFLLAILCLPGVIYSQERSSGIIFQDGLTWYQIKEKAKLANKYIFVDCYTTWCGPCKNMDKDVFADTKVSDFFKDKFISYKLQMDESLNDGESAKKLYADAKYFQKKYKVNSYPCFLFFSPDGELVHKAGSYQKVDDFLAIAKEALIPGKNYKDPFAEYNRLANEYHTGKKDYAKMPYMINKGSEAGDNELVQKLLNEYSDWLINQPEATICTKENLELLRMQMNNSKSRFFYLFFPEGRKPDMIMNNAYFSSDIVDKIILNEEIRPLFKTAGGKEPNWSSIYATIQNRYGKSFAERNTLKGELEWYNQQIGPADKHPLMDKWIELSMQKIQMYGTDLSVWQGISEYNGVAWRIFINSTDKKQLNTAIRFMSKALKSDANKEFQPKTQWDTYAALLYKVGRIKEAIKWEKKALDDLKWQNNPFLDKQIQKYASVIEKMERGEPTYTEQGAVWSK